MAHSARFQQVENAVALAVRFDVSQRDPGIHQRRNAAFALAHLLVDRRQTGEDCGDSLGLADVGKPDESRMDFSRGTAECRYRIDDDRGRLELLDVAVHPRKMHLKPEQAWSRRFEPEQARFEMRLEIDTDRSHVSHDLVGDSSNAKYRDRSPRPHAASAKAAPKVDLPVPARPEIRMLDPLK